MFKYPLHKRLQNLTKNRLKRTSLNHVLKEQQRKQSDILVPRPSECEMLTHNRTPLVLKAKVKFSIPGISTKSSDSEASLKTLTLAELDKSHYYSNTGWRSVLKLQSRSTSIPHCDRDCHPAGEKTKEGCAPHRLPICTAITCIRKSRRLHLTKFITKFKHPDIKNNSRTSMDTCTYRHTWKRSGLSAGERGKQEAAAKIQT